jgi:hypothetical protein
MQDRLAARLETLRQEYQTGQTMRADLEAKQLDLRQTLLRIAGAIQVLESSSPTPRRRPATGTRRGRRRTAATWSKRTRDPGPPG